MPFPRARTPASPLTEQKILNRRDRLEPPQRSPRNRGTCGCGSFHHLEGLAQGLGELLNGALVALVPSPVAFLLRFDQAGLLQDTHVMRDGGL